MKLPGKTLAKAALIGPELLGGAIVAGAAVGIGLGVGLGILLAPDKGSATRKKITDTGSGYVEDAKDTFFGIIDDVKERFTGNKEEELATANGSTNGSSEGASPMEAKKPTKVTYTGNDHHHHQHHK